MRKLGYAATDYIIITAVILAAIIPFLFISSDNIKDTDERLLYDAAASIDAKARQLLNIGPNSADTVTIMIPQGIIAADGKISTGTGRFRVAFRNIENEFFYQFPPQIEGSIPILPGRYFLRLRNIDGRVYIYECGNGILEKPEQCEVGNILNCGPMGCVGPGQENECSCKCSDSTQCPTGLICENGVCKQCEGDVQCSPPEVCLGGRCKTRPTPMPDCRFVPCEQGLHCNDRDGRCENCRRDQDCIDWYGADWTCSTPGPNGHCIPPECTLSYPACSSVCPTCNSAREQCSSSGICCLIHPYCYPGSIPRGCVNPCPPGETCQNEQCEPIQPPSGCQSNTECNNYPFEVCDTSSGTCRPCSTGNNYCDLAGNGFTCRATDAAGQNGVCGECKDNNDCNYPTDVCDPFFRKCKPCTWGFFQCNYFGLAPGTSDICSQGTCVPIQTPRVPQGNHIACGSAPQQPGQVACDPYSCPGGKVCMRQGGGCECVSFLPWWQAGGYGPIPPPGRRDPGAPPNPAPNPAQAQPMNPGSTPSACAYNPFATMTPGNPNSLCAGSCSGGKECIITGSTTCTCEQPGTYNWFEIIGIAFPVEYTWIVERINPSGPGPIGP